MVVSQEKLKRRRGMQQKGACKDFTRFAKHVGEYKLSTPYPIMGKRIIRY